VFFGLEIWIAFKNMSHLLLKKQNWSIQLKIICMQFVRALDKNLTLKSTVGYIPPALQWNTLDFAHRKYEAFWHNWCDQGRIAGCAEHPYRTHQGCLKIGRSAGNGAYVRKGTSLRVMVAKVSFWLDGSTSSGNYGWFSVCVRQLLFFKTNKKKGYGFISPETV
jgi:hypothetical protein